MIPVSQKLRLQTALNALPFPQMTPLIWDISNIAVSDTALAMSTDVWEGQPIRRKLDKSTGEMN